MMEIDQSGKPTGRILPDRPPAPPDKVEAIVRQQFRLVLQGAAEHGSDWRDLENLPDGEYARNVMPVRLQEYRLGFPPQKHTGYRLVLRKIEDTVLPNNRISSSDKS